MTNFFVRIAHGIEKGTKKVAPVAEHVIPLIPVIPAPVATLANDAFSLLPSVGDKHNKVENLVSISKGESMNPLESFGFTIALGVVHSVIKNPAHAAQVKTLLVGMADAIYSEYGMTTPAQTTQSGQPLAK